ncbi:MAG: ABC-2 transporter permease [Clostridia bacterium]|nr:ABC-2 transporter permease [Clostridia bacterium]NCC68829.1 ABC-2 transporter permease [Clostridia bacterium]
MMKGLLLKDIINLKQQIRIYLLIIAIWLALTIVNEDSNFFGGVMMMLSVLVPISAMAYDDKAKWDKYALTMPVSKKDLVNSKYVLMLLCAVVGGFISEVVSVIITKDVGNSLTMTMVFMSLGIIFASIVLPLIFKFGTEKGRLIMFLVVLLPSLGAVLLSKLGIELPGAEAVEKAMVFLPFTAIAAIVLSMLISTAIYNRKEF